jgi:hypothetical protein
MLSNEIKPKRGLRLEVNASKCKHIYACVGIKGNILRTPKLSSHFGSWTRFRCPKSLDQGLNDKSYSNCELFFIFRKDLKSTILSFRFPFSKQNLRTWCYCDWRAHSSSIHGVRNLWPFEGLKIKLSK